MNESGEPRQDMVPVEPDYRIRAMSKIDEWEHASVDLRTSADLDTEDGKQAMFRMSATATAQAQHSVGKPLHVVHWMLHEVDRVDEATGEAYRGLRLCLLLVDGTTVSTASDSLIDGWARVYRAYRKEPTWPVLEIQLKANRRAGGAGNWLELEWVRRVVAVQSVKAKR